MSLMKTVGKGIIEASLSPRFRRLPPMPTISDMIRIYKVSARKNLGQNFILDENICDKLVKSSGLKFGSTVIEIGPGPGGITRSLVKLNPEKIVIIEKDTRFSQLLRILCESTNIPIHVVFDDVMQCSFEDTFESKNEPKWDVDEIPKFGIIGNLPFNVSTAIVVKWMKQISERQSAWKYHRVPMTLTFQKEICDRIVCQPNSLIRSRLSFICQIYCNCKSVYDIPNSVFVPRPKVDAGTVHFIPRKKPLINHPFPLINKIITHLFNHKSKHILFNIRKMFPQENVDLADLLMLKVDIDPTMNITSLNIVQFNKICNAFVQICKDFPHLYHQ
ncbi:hypothetical protein A3Q56_00329 [Intoshia linei]|uniref:rRNA adenine N(6)-methyltransferase n=1 Tax=Intoshia linei TaxID=1819745 RepID=A0A177BE93_9BILA|nr:hypothetical protein A3Q56_00329 [Intoshia linei]